VILVKNQARIVVPFSTETEANIAFNTLRVDKEPIRGGVEKNFSVEGSNLVVNFEGEQAKHLRVSVNTLLDLLILVVQTIDKFGPATP
jgi:tRNA threonylcarbamoyladenosine modification (KEOPS) complex  Pcc1 subunit